MEYIMPHYKSPKTLAASIGKYNLRMTGFTINVNPLTATAPKRAYHTSNPVWMQFGPNSYGNPRSVAPRGKNSFAPVGGDATIGRTVAGAFTTHTASMTMGNVMSIADFIRVHPKMPSLHKQQFTMMKRISKTPVFTRKR